MATTTNTRKRKCLSLEKKYEILQAVEKKQVSLAEICRRFDIPNGSIHTIIKDKEKISAAYSQGKFTQDRKKMRTADTDIVDQALLKWFKDARAKLVPLSGPILIEKAQDFATRLGVNNFTGSVGWLGRFKERHNIKIKTICGESATVSSSTTDEWINSSLKALLEEYDPKDIYNADETGLFYKCLPTATLAQKGENTSGPKAPKDRLTLLVATNMTGSDKLPLLTIGKFEKPRCFKNIRTLPTEYKWNRKAWMTSIIWEEWVRKLDRKMLLQGRSIALIIDNCSAHPAISNLRAIEMIYLPPNTTSVLQPCDQGIIQSLKVHYRKRMLKEVVANIDAGGDAKFHLKMSILDAMVTAADAWNDVKQETVANCFKHAGFKKSSQPQQDVDQQNECPFLEDEKSEVGQLLDQLRKKNIDDVPSAEALVEVDSNVQTTATLTDDEIVSAVQQTTQDSSPSPEEEDESLATPPVTSKQCLEALQTAMAYIMQQTDSDAHLHQLSSVKSFVQDSATNKCKQKKMEDFFKRN